MAYFFSISALKTIDWIWHNIVAKVNLNMTFSIEDKAKKKQTSSAWNVFHFQCDQVLMKLKTLKSFEITSFCPTVCFRFFPRLNKMNADRSTLSYALMGSLINLDRYQYLCTFWLCFGYDFCVVWSVVRRDVLI